MDIPEGAKVPQDRLMKKTRSIKKLSFILDADAAWEYEKAEAEYQQAQLYIDETPEVLAKIEEAKIALEAARELALEYTVDYVFQAIGRKAYDALVDAHPPSDKAIAAAKAQGAEEQTMQWDPDTFPPELISKCMVAPAKLTVDEVREQLWDSDDWSGAELEMMFVACIAANQNRRIIDRGNG